MANSLIFSHMRYAIGRALVGNKTRQLQTKWNEVRFNSTFEAACLREYGKPLVIDKFNEEPLKDDEVRVQVKYCSLNSRDVEYLEKNNKKDKKLPFIPGYELSGEVAEVGDDSKTNVRAGSRVVGLAATGCGGLASRASLLSQDVWELPPNVPSKDAAALICGHATALLAFTEFRPLNEGDVILVIAGPAGYGLAAVEVAASIFKAKVIGLSDTEGKAGLLRDRGAFAAFKSDLKHNYKEIMKATDNKGVDLIYDAVGGPVLNTVIKCMKDVDTGMVLATYRTDRFKDAEKHEEDDVDEKDVKKNFKKSKTIAPEILEKIKTVNIFDHRSEHYEKYYSLIEQTLQFCDEQLISAHVSQSFQLADTNEAIQYIKGKMCTGKVLIKINND